MTDPHPLAAPLAEADRGLVRTVDALADGDLGAPSLLPGWSRAHVVAHLALNAEGLAGVLHGAHLGESRPMYASPEARDGDIEDLVAAGPTALRDRLLGGTTGFSTALAAMHPADWDGRFERTPGGPELALANVALMRLREVEIHHADLGAGYRAEDWSSAFAEVLLDSMTKRPYPAPFVGAPDDMERSWQYGEGTGGPRVSGPASAMAWWVTGRGSGESLTSDSGQLPEVGSW